MAAVSHPLKAIYITVPKTASRYLAELLEKYYGFVGLLVKRSNSYKTLGGDQSTISHENKKLGTLSYYHGSAEFAEKTEITPEQWKSYYKFSFIRHPYDRMYSGYNFLKISIPFSQFIRSSENPSIDAWTYWHCFMSQTRHLSDPLLQMDFLGSFEHLEEDLARVIKHLTGYNPIHPVVKKPPPIYRELISKEDREYLAQLMKDDFVNFGYKN